MVEKCLWRRLVFRAECLRLSLPWTGDWAGWVWSHQNGCTVLCFLAVRDSNLLLLSQLQTHFPVLLYTCMLCSNFHMRGIALAPLLASGNNIVSAPSVTGRNDSWQLINCLVILWIVCFFYEIIAKISVKSYAGLDMVSGWILLVCPS